MRRLLPALLTFVAGCAGGSAAPRSPAPMTTPPVAQSPATALGTTYDTTWYVTNRARQNGALVRAAADSLEFGFVVSRYREHAGVEAHFLEDVVSERVDSARLTREEFIARLRARDSVAATTGDGTIMYVHGYAVSFGHAIKQASDIHHRGSHRGPMLVFSWPAHVGVVTWPTTMSPVSRAYREDLVMAAQSREAFREAVDVVRSAVRPGAFTVVGHSMGSQLVSEALSAPGTLHESLRASPLGALVFFAADIGIARFRDSLAAPLQAVALRRVVYSSDDDVLMGLSRRMNHEARVGQASPARGLTSLGVEVIDVSSGIRARYGIRRVFEPGHAMRNASSALYDFFGVVRGMPADCRAAVGVAALSEDGSWRLSGAPLPAEPPSFQACSTLSQRLR